MSKFKGSRLAKSGKASIAVLPAPKKCTACNGTGRYGIKNSPKCSACDGTGVETK